MKYIIRGALLSMLLACGFSSLASEADNFDKRISLHLTKAEKADFLIEMRGMLSSIQGVMSGISDKNRTLIINSARYSGNRMARATPKSVKQKTPKLFKEIGGSTHMMFEELVVRAEDEDMESLTSFTATLMKNCLTCHETYRAN